MKLFLSVFIVCAACLSTFAAYGASAPRMAIWDPAVGSTESRFQIDLNAQKQLATSLKQGGIDTALLTAEQLASADTFSAKAYDAVFFIGSAFPHADIDALKRFADEGGVIIALDAQVPFLIAIEHGPDNQWQLSPQEPRFAWQTTELLKHFGLQYKFDATLHDQGTNHTATPLLRQYLPQAKDLRGKMPSRWIVPQEKDGGQIIPLIRSQRSDGADVPPQLYLATRDHRTLIVSTSSLFTTDLRPRIWPLAQQTVVALAHLAHDLHEKQLDLRPEMAVRITNRPPIPPMPLDRMAIGSVDPEGAKPIARWGDFDGSCAEFGPALKASAAVDVAPGAKPADIPVALEAQSTLRLALPPLPQGSLYLRIRAAYVGSGATLKAAIGNELLHNENLVYIDTSGPGNFSRSLSGMPVEFTRIIYLPPTARGSVLTLSNPGTVPLYFDAIQLEQPTQPARERMIGLGAPAGKLASPELAAQWTGLRMSLRTQFIGKPDDPKRFAKVDELFNRVAALNPRVEPILEGTPDWAAISPERLADAQQAKRPTTVPPDPQKYAEIVEQVVRRYGDRISTYEIWNEADITQFYRGTSEEYATLFKTIIPIIRKLDPTAKIMMTGMAGYHEDFIRRMSDAGVLSMIDLLAFHPYAGKSAGWDLAFGLTEGCILSQGCGKEIYCNESGFPSSNTEWFVPPPQMTQETQHDLLNLAIARLLANGISKLSVFNAGGDGNPYGLFDRAGKPLPAYEVFADYALLGQNGARRLDVSLTSPAGGPLQGVYAAASTHADGSVTLVLNPADCDALKLPVDPTPALSGSGGWTCFFGAARFADGRATITPAEGKPAAGFYKVVSLDPTAYPTLDLTVSGDTADWELVLKQNGATIPAVTRQGAGTVHLDLAKLLPGSGRRDVELSFRFYKPTTLESLRLPAAPDFTPAPLKPLPVRVRLPLQNPVVKATLREGARQTPLEMNITSAAGETCADIIVPLRQRSVIRLAQ